MHQEVISTPIAQSRSSALDWVRFGGWGNGLVLAGAWLVLIAASGLYRHDFISHQTVLAVTFTMAITGILAVGQALVGISGGILDLSQPAALVLTAYVVSRLI